MDPRIVLILIARAPRLFDSHRASPRMPWSLYGFQCSEGWAPLLLEVLGRIEAIIDQSNYSDLAVTQIKEKYAELKIHLNVNISDPAHDELRAFIEDAAKRSQKICEWCGEPGEMIEVHHWWRVACENELHRGRWDMSDPRQSDEVQRCTKLILDRMEQKADTGRPSGSILNQHELDKLVGLVPRTTEKASPEQEPIDQILSATRFLPTDSEDNND